MAVRSGLIPVYLIICTQAYAGGISGPVSFPSASVLPSGVRTMQYKGIMAQGENRFDDQGKTQALGQSFNKVLTYQDLVDNEETVQDQLFAEAKVNSTPGVALDQSMGETTGQVNLAVNVHTPVFATGINKAWTMAVAVPIIQSDMNVDVGAASDESLQAAADILSQPGQAMTDKLQTIQTKFANATQNKLKDNGYKPLQDENKTQLGDVQLISKYNFLKDGDYTLTLQNSVTLPTGKQADVNKLVDVGAGDEQFDLGLGINADRHIGEKITISGSLNYIAQLPDHTAMRVRKKSDSKITPDIDSSARRDLGDIVQASTAAKFTVLKHYNIQTGYAYQYKTKDKYSGSKYAQYRYDLHSEETDQELHAAQLGLSFDTISMYRAGKFSVPLEMGLGYTKPLAGKNVVSDSLATFNLSVFF